MNFVNQTKPSISALDLLSDLKAKATPNFEEEQILRRHKEEIPKILENLKYEGKIGQYIIEKKEDKKMPRGRKPKQTEEQPSSQEILDNLPKINNVQIDNDVLKNFLQSRIDDCNKQKQIIEGQISAYYEILNNLY